MLNQSTKWDELKLGDILKKIIGGGTPSKAEPSYWGGNIPWASVKDMADEVYRLTSTIDHITELGLKNSASNLIPKGTVIISTRMGLGRCFRAEMDIAINQDLKALFPNGRTISEFLIWLMVYLSPSIVSMGTGTTVKGIRLEQLQYLDVKLPPLPTQRKIAAILSTYDDLIENNTRRIKILEEMAQALYREWFVHFRFPGHEGVRMVESELGMVPEGWEIKKATDAIYVNPTTKVPKEGEKPFVSMGNLSNDSMFVNSFEYRSGNSGSKFKNGDTLFARITPCLENGKTAYVQFLQSNNDIAFGSTEFIVLRSKTLCSELVYLMARSNEFRDNAIKSMSGATGRQRVQEACFDKFLFAHPDSKIISAFVEHVSPLLQNAYILNKKSANLRRTRDLLLPKLISGEVDVECFDITIGYIHKPQQ